MSPQQKSLRKGATSWTSISKHHCICHIFTLQKEATHEFVNDVPSYILHGNLVEPNYRYCPYCHGSTMHLNGTRIIRLRHITIGKSIIYVEVTYKRWECQDCHRTFRHRIPFKEKGHNITTTFAKEIEHFLSIGEGKSSPRKFVSFSPEILYALTHGTKRR